VYERIRLALEELGPTFVKFGQILSTRTELLPPPLIAELKKLQDQVAPLPYSAIAPSIQKACPVLEECFLEVEETPIASASLAQVHRARLRDGTPVVLKVQRPNIQEIIETDLAILQSLAARLEHSVPDSRVYNPSGMVRDFSAQIRRELDFIRDGKNAERIARNFMDVPGIRIPHICWEYSTNQNLVMEYIEGVRVDDVEGIRRSGADPKEIAVRGFSAYMKMIFEDGFFHGDPHPGNLLVTPEGDLAFLDFGIVGIFSPEKRDLFTSLLIGIHEADADLVMRVFEGLGIDLQKVDKEILKDDLYGLLYDHEYTLREFHFSTMVEDLTEVMRRNHLRVPMTMMLMLKVIMQVGDIGHTLDPDFNFWQETTPYLTRASKERMDPRKYVQKTATSVARSLEDLVQLPSQANITLKNIANGQLRFEIVDAKRFRATVHRSSDKLMVGLITSAIVIGSSVVLLASGLRIPDTVFFLALFGYGIAVVIGFYFLYHALFWGRND
jgi:ubiquinone biosynthesis protein